MTIVESIKCVLQQNNDGLTSKQIYDEIIRQGLYSFGAENPVGVVNAQLRRCLLYTSPSPRDRQKSRMPSSA